MGEAGLRFFLSPSSFITIFKLLILHRANMGKGGEGGHQTKQICTSIFVVLTTATI